MQLEGACIIPLGQQELRILKSGLRLGSTWDVQRHCNAEWEFHFIRKGTCQVDIEADNYRLTAGQALLIEPGLYHQAKVLTPEFERFTLCFTLSPGPVYQQLSAQARPAPVFSPGLDIQQTIDRILQECNSNHGYTDTYLDALIRCLAVELLRAWNACSQAPSPNQEDRSAHLTQIIDTYFEQHFSDSGGEAELAKLLHFSRRHLIRILQKHYGMNFREKLTQARMDYAALLLRTTDQSISRIGADVGYGSESAFFKIFRRSYGMTPRQYRNMHK